VLNRPDKTQFRPPAAPRLLAMALALCPLAPAVLPAAPAAGWEIAKHDGRDYVSVDSMKRFYSFTKLTRNGNDIVLENPKVEMHLKIGGYECLMNGVKFVFTHQVAATNLTSRAWISRN